MGQKVNPKGFRLGLLYGWESRWFARGKEYAANLHSDLLIKKFLEKMLKTAGIANIEIERTRNAVTIIIHSSSPGMIIGRSGAGAEEIKKKIKQKFFGSTRIQINLNIVEVPDPTTNAQLVLNGVALEIEKRMPFRRSMKQAMERVQKAGAKGVKICIAGRLNGAEIARSETLSWGNIPLHTLRANIDYSRGVAHTMYGIIGIKVWIYKGDVFQESKVTAKQEA